MAWVANDKCKRVPNPQSAYSFITGRNKANMKNKYYTYYRQFPCQLELSLCGFSIQALNIGKRLFKVSVPLFYLGLSGSQSGSHPCSHSCSYSLCISSFS